MNKVWTERAVSPAEAVARTSSGQAISLHGGAAAPIELEAALCLRTDLVDRLLPSHEPGAISVVEQAIGDRISEMIEDGSTLQLGIGAIPDAVVTEYGAVNLHDLSLRQRGEALISIAHPDFRARLTTELREQRHFALPTPP